MVQGGSIMLEKDKSKANRMLRSSAARTRRKTRKAMMEARTLSLFARLKRLRRKKSLSH
jgi:hypothetical protein